jgi:hypothetical protein
MDTMKLLLGATVALLLGALAVSWTGMTNGLKNTDAAEIARLQKQVAEIQQEQEKLALEKQIQQLRNDPVSTPSANAAEIAQMKAQMEADQAALRQLEAEKAARDQKVDDAEELLGDQKRLEKGDGELRRARMISEALLIGRVKEYIEDPQYGGFVTFDVLMPEQVQAGTIIAIRRKTGILGQLKVSDVSAEGAIANPLPGFGPVGPVAGDELILPPLY